MFLNHITISYDVFIDIYDLVLLTIHVNRLGALPLVDAWQALLADQYYCDQSLLSTLYISFRIYIRLTIKHNQLGRDLAYRPLYLFRNFHYGYSSVSNKTDSVIE